MGRALGGVQHRLVIQITGRKTRRLLDGSCDYFPLEAVMEEAEFEEVEAYVLMRQNMVAQHITT